MEHPFIASLEDKSIEELQKVLTDLMPKLTYAHRTGNGPLIHQLHMVFESYKAEHLRRMNAQMDKLLKDQQSTISIEG